MAAGLLLTALVLGTIGEKDVSEALTFGGRLAGATFVFATAVELIAVIAAFDYLGKRHWIYSGAAVLIGVLIALSFNALLLYVQINAGEYTRYAWIWPTVLLWSFWALWNLNPRQVWRQSPHPRSVATGAVVAALISVGNLAYTRAYAPYAAAVSIDIVVKFGKPQLNAERRVLHLPMHVAAKNSGQVPVYILGTLYEVYGRSTNFTEKARSVTEWKGDILAGRDAERYAEIRGRELISYGAIAKNDRGSSLEPGDVLSEDKILTIPANSQFDAIEGSGEVIVMREDRAKLYGDYLSGGTVSWDDKLSHAEDAPAWVAIEAGDEYLRYHGRLSCSSEILNVTRRPRYATFWWVTHKPRDGKSEEDTYLVATISFRGEEGRQPSTADPDEIFETYGVFHISNGQTREPFAALVKPPTE
ncbi:hypothetical protein [Streptomyces virginiae]|uniref:hypothetical protein n=1 Tax=Streptomyces virginiae TaxID=1961 RepID=UPI00386CC2A1|nr:hypothetical protein OG253_13965 [Streptomyces virginiae]